ncbi:MAG: DUF488 domain-containing protein [Proteobacteria bacterium]|nr:DUF488 domain-containing protein [Pseudomonadota bacterium]
MTSTRLHTIGYQGASVEGFIAALKTAGVETLIDVRAVPASRRREFSKRNLAASLEAAGLTYVHLVGLGNPKEGREAAKAGRLDDYRRIYTAHLDSEAGRDALARAAEIAAASPSYLMCLEADPAFCHRSMVAERLAGKWGFDVENLAGAPAKPHDQRQLAFGEI